MFAFQSRIIFPSVEIWQIRWIENKTASLLNIHTNAEQMKSTI